MKYTCAMCAWLGRRVDSEMLAWPRDAVYLGLREQTIAFTAGRLGAQGTIDASAITYGNCGLTMNQLPRFYGVATPSCQGSLWG